MFKVIWNVCLSCIVCLFAKRVSPCGLINKIKQRTEKDWNGLQKYPNTYLFIGIFICQWHIGLELLAVSKARRWETRSHWWLAKLLWIRMYRDGSSTKVAKTGQYTPRCILQFLSRNAAWSICARNGILGVTTTACVSWAIYRGIKHNWWMEIQKEKKIVHM